MNFNFWKAPSEFCGTYLRVAGKLDILLGRSDIPAVLIFFLPKRSGFKLCTVCSVLEAESKKGLAGLKSLCRQGCVLSGDPWGESMLLLFSASRGCLAPMAPGAPSRVCRASGV